MYVLDIPVQTTKARRGVWDLYGIGDPQFDKRTCNRELLERWVKFIASRGPYGLAWCVGDVIDGTLPTHKFFRPSTIRPTDLSQMESYIDAMVEESVALFQPIIDAGMPLVFNEGNHDIRIPGIGFIQALVRRLNGGKLTGPHAFYAGGECLARVKADDTVWTIYGAHGAGGGSLPGGRVNRHARDGHIADADIFIRGHVEEGAVRIVPRHFVPRSGKATLAERPVAYYTCAGFTARRVQGVVDYSGRASMGPLDGRVSWLEVHNPNRDGTSRVSAHHGRIYQNDFRG